ncbi:MAG: hypothetical protein LBG83_02555 [Oscillospiraceae bacterium]|jgi:chromosome segregation ATPase|nr:hypothetical protein [Oscillospiraceae bacterium]
MEQQEYPFRPRGRHGFDREDVINYISQAQQRCNEHLARMEELEAAKNAWYTQAKSMEREKTSLVARNRELEEQLERGASATVWSDPVLSGAYPQEQELAALKSRCLDLEQAVAAAEQELRVSRGEAAEASALRGEQQVLREELQTLRGTNASLRRELDERDAREAGLEREKTALENERAMYANRVASLESENVAIERAKAAMAEQAAEAGLQLERLNRQVAELESAKAVYAERFPALNEQVRQLDALRGEKAALGERAAQLEYELAALRQEREHLVESLNASEGEKAVYEKDFPALQEQLAQLAERAEQISGLNEEKAALAAQLEAARGLHSSSKEKTAALTEELEKVQQQLDVLAHKNAELTQREAQARQEAARLLADAERLQKRVEELEGISAAQTGETLRSMVLASFNYSDLYVDNNLKTAQFISDTTSHNISRVSDSAGTLLEQLDSITREFTDTTDTIRRNLASFQRELGQIQNGMNRRLSKNRFSALLEENERLRKLMEQELLEELEAEDETPIERPLEQSGKLPFAEDLPPSYHSYLDD